MKKLFAIFALAFLTSCIDVEDISAVWGKGVVDPALEGTWALKNEKWRLAKEDGAYRLEKIDDTGKPDGDAILARTIVVSKRTFLLTTDNAHKNGAIFRFDVQGDTATQYGFKNPAIVMDWMRSKHPQEKNITLTSKEMMGANLKILTLDAATLAILANVPDAYWEVMAQYKKVAH